MTISSAQALLSQALNQLVGVQALWSNVNLTLLTDPGNDPCQGLGGPASLVGALQSIGSQACTTTHSAAAAALAFTLNCFGVGAANANNAQNAMLAACKLNYTYLPQYGPSYGTVAVTGAQNATCLDYRFLNAVGQQVANAAYAVAQAQATFQACINAGSVTKSASAANLSLPPMAPVVFRSAGRVVFPLQTQPLRIQGRF